MISKFSVKKPYTVIVAVVLVIILGVVSFTKMSTDLLPSMDLPYAIVMTTYPGASPETVEQTVTKPIEQSMATVSNIKNVSSMSSENASVVILEFGESTNMDSVTLEMRENLDQIKGYWDDSVGNPIIMKLNPDMMPVLVAAADVDGMSAAEVTDYIENNVQSELESIDGVARISVSGNVTESIQVQISQEKLDAVNQKVQDAINGQFEEKEQDLADEPSGALDSKAADSLMHLFHTINMDGQTIVMVTHSVKAASSASRVLFIKDGEVFHQLYRGNMTNEEMYHKISATLTVLTTGGEIH